MTTASLDAAMPFSPAKVTQKPLGAADIRSAQDLPLPATFEEIYELHFDFVWRNLRRLGVPEAGVDDAVQEVFLVILKRFGELSDPEGLKKWIFAIVYRVACETRRSLRRKPEAAHPETIEVETLADGGEGCPHKCAERRETAQTLHRLLDELDDDKRAVFVLSELEEMTAPEIAQVLALNLNTVYARLRAARREFEQAVLREQARDGWRLR